MKGFRDTIDDLREHTGQYMTLEYTNYRRKYVFLMTNVEVDASSMGWLRVRFAIVIQENPEYGTRNAMAHPTTLFMVPDRTDKSTRLVPATNEETRLCMTIMRKQRLSDPLRYAKTPIMTYDNDKGKWVRK